MNPLTFLEKLGYSKRQILAAYARLSVGKDLNQGIIDKEYGCAVVANAICNNALGFPVGGNASTHLMYQALRFSLRWRQVKPEEAQAGDLIIAPTGEKIRPSLLENGHVGYFADNVGDDITPTKIISNNSRTGLVDTVFSFGSFYKRYAIDGGYRIFIYRLMY